VYLPRSKPRAGFKTALVEKTVWFGGLATSSLINIYLPLCDGNGKQVIFGIVEELLQLSMRYGPGTVPPDWTKVSIEVGMRGIDPVHLRRHLELASFLGSPILRVVADTANHHPTPDEVVTHYIFLKTNSMLRAFALRSETTIISPVPFL